MAFLVDECVARQVVLALRSNFEDVVYVPESAPSMPDLEVLRWANREKRTLITEDYDFGDLAIHARLRAHAVVIIGPGVFRGNEEGSAEAIAGRIVKLADTFAGRLTILERRRTRQRDL